MARGKVKTWATHRPVVMGTHGMVSTGHPLASIEALRVLMDGGNAMDAALTAAGVLSVVKSYHCGLGGDVFLVFYSAREQKVYALNESGRAPYGLQREHYRDGIPVRGIFAVTVPGAAEAWAQAAQRFASRTLKDLLRPAIAYAENGFPVFPNLARVIESSVKRLRKDPAWSKIFLPGGGPPRSGELLYLKDLARSLSDISEQGSDVFYKGWIAGSILRTSEEEGGCFEPRDFAEHHSRWEEPIHASYRGYEVSVPPPNSYGLLLLLQLRLLEGYEVERFGPSSPEYLALQLELREQASGDGEPWIADPDGIDRETPEKFIQSYPAQRRAGATLSEAVSSGGDTTYLATADREGNWVSLIQSVHHSFGCGIVVDGTGIVLNNRMAGFNLIPGHPNELGPPQAFGAHP